MPPSSPIYVPSTAPNIAEWLTSLREASPANPTASSANAEELRTSATSGPTPSGSLARWDPNGSYWRMSPDSELPPESLSRYLKQSGNSVYLVREIKSRAQGSSFVTTSRLADTHTWEQLSGSFPTSVMTVGLHLYLLPPLVLLTSDGDGGVLPESLGLKATHHVPSPTASDYITRRSTSKERLNYETNKTVNLNRWVARWPTPDASVMERDNRSLSPGAATRPTLAKAARMWPTPQSFDAKATENWAPGSEWDRNKKEHTLPQAVRMWPTPGAQETSGGAANPVTMRRQGHQVKLRDAVGMWPTPLEGDATGSRGTKGKERPDEGGLAKAVNMWPTPKGSPDHYGQPREKDRDDLQAAVRYPTPQAGTNNPAAHNAMSGDFKRRLAEATGEPVTGQLNPTWVEWLMGFPIGWTASEPLGMESYRRWLRSF